MKILTRQIWEGQQRVNVSSWRKFRQGVTCKLSKTMKATFSSFGIPENGFGVIFFPQTISCAEAKFLINGKRENAYFHVETASGSRQT